LKGKITADLGDQINQLIQRKDVAVVTERGKMLAGDMVGFTFTPYWLRIWLEI